MLQLCLSWSVDSLFGWSSQNCCQITKVIFRFNQISSNKDVSVHLQFVYKSFNNLSNVQVRPDLKTLVWLVPEIEWRSLRLQLVSVWKTWLRAGEKRQTLAFYFLHLSKERTDELVTFCFHRKHFTKCFQTRGWVTGGFNSYWVKNKVVTYQREGGLRSDWSPSVTDEQEVSLISSSWNRKFSSRPEFSCTPWKTKQNKKTLEPTKTLQTQKPKPNLDPDPKP